MASRRTRFAERFFIGVVGRPDDFPELLPRQIRIKKTLRLSPTNDELIRRKRFGNSINSTGRDSKNKGLFAHSGKEHT